jgi:hypothetical protein
VRLLSFLPKQNRSKRVLIAIGLVALVGFGTYVVMGQRAGENPLFLLFPGETISDPAPPPMEPNVLNGVPVEITKARRRPLAIMVENHTEARPQVGLTKAAIVYEAIAEGGITRFLAVYGPFDSDKIGPVRSARQYYVEWTKGMDALYAHVGGSQDARNLIRTLGVADLDQFRYGTQAYWREPQAGVAIEHTMFTSTDKLYDVAKKAKFDLTATFTPYKFKEDVPAAERGEPHTITINFSLPSYRVAWEYDSAANTYLRSHGGVAHVDRETGERVTAKTIAVVVLKRQLKTEEDGPGWIMTTTGSGKAAVYQDGQVIEATWKRPTNTDLLRFFDQSGSEIALNRGQLWVEVVHAEVRYGTS